MKLRSKVMRGDICQLWLLVATLALGTARGSELCKRGQSWWDRHRELCIPCTKCDPGRRLAVKYPCEIHRDTICQFLYEVKIWPFNTPSRRSRKDNDPVRRDKSGSPSDYEYYEYADYDSEVTERNNEHEVTWDMQTTSLTLAASGCVVFFLVVIVLSLYHAKQWKVLKSVLTSDVQDLTAKLKLMESGGESTIQPVVSTDHHLYCNIHIGKEALLDSTALRKGMGNVYTQEKHQS